MLILIWVGEHFYLIIFWVHYLPNNIIIFAHQHASGHVKIMLEHMHKPKCDKAPSTLFCLQLHPNTRHRDRSTYIYMVTFNEILVCKEILFAVDWLIEKLWIILGCSVGSSRQSDKFLKTTLWSIHTSLLLLSQYHLGSFHSIHNWQQMNKLAVFAKTWKWGMSSLSHTSWHIMYMQLQRCMNHNLYNSS